MVNVTGQKKAKIKSLTNMPIRFTKERLEYTPFRDWNNSKPIAVEPNIKKYTLISPYFLRFKRARLPTDTKPNATMLVGSGTALAVRLKLGIMLGVAVATSSLVAVASEGVNVVLLPSPSPQPINTAANTAQRINLFIMCFFFEVDYITILHPETDHEGFEPPSTWFVAKHSVH